MKKVILTLVLLLTFSFVFSSNTTIEKKPNKSNIKTEYVYVLNSEGMDHCYIRYCTYSTGSGGTEIKTCTDWEEIDCEGEALPPVYISPKK